MEGIIKIAGAYYERASAEERILAKEYFRKLDADKDGKVSRQDLKKYLSPSLSNEKVFEQLDEDGDGTLGFDEVLALYYMDNKIEMLYCSGCRGLLAGPYFSCLLCLGEGSNTFNLCCDCHLLGVFDHEHPSTNLVDHHSLLSRLRDSKKEMKELTEIAKAHYKAGSPEVQALAYDFFKSMDTDGDDRVDLSEFLEFMRQEGYSHMYNPQFFKKLDRDSNGTLDFWEVMTLYYIIKSGRPFCGCCENFIPGIFFSCVECFKTPQSSFNLCRDCYRSTKCKHNHNGRAQFLDNYTLLEAKRDFTLAQATGVNSITPWATATPNAITPVQQSNIYYHNNYSTYNTYNIIDPAQTPASPNYSNAIAPASNWNKWKVALHALEAALSIGSVSATLCTIL